MIDGWWTVPHFVPLHNYKDRVNIALDVMLLHIHAESIPIVPYVQIIMVTWYEYEVLVRVIFAELS